LHYDHIVTVYHRKLKVVRWLAIQWHDFHTEYDENLCLIILMFVVELGWVDTHTHAHILQKEPYGYPKN